MHVSSCQLHTICLYYMHLFRVGLSVINFYVCFPFEQRWFACTLPKHGCVLHINRINRISTRIIVYVCTLCRHVWPSCFCFVAQKTCMRSAKLIPNSQIRDAINRHALPVVRFIRVLICFVLFCFLFYSTLFVGWFEWTIPLFCCLLHTLVCYFKFYSNATSSRKSRENLTHPADIRQPKTPRWNTR